MISFRYHLVSIIAVFLALAVGIVLGTAALNGPIQTNLNNNLSRVTSEKRGLEGDVEQLREQLTSSDAFAVAVGPRLVRGSLADHRVLLVTTPETPPELSERLTPLLRAAGAQVGGTLQLLPALADPAQGQLVEDLVAQVVPAGVELPDTSPVERATAELAAALVRPSQGRAVEPEEAQAVVSGFAEADLVEFTGAGETLQPATLAVVLGGPAPARLPAPAQAGQAAVLSLVAALDGRSDGTVVAGPAGSAGERGLVQALRADSQVVRRVSSVDNADRGTGQVSAVLALAEQTAGKAGQYGSGEGASGALPGATAS
jgi:hypothetical protein